jgi:hypothetical protein
MKKKIRSQRCKLAQVSERVAVYVRDGVVVQIPREK